MGEQEGEEERKEFMCLLLEFGWRYLLPCQVEDLDEYEEIVMNGYSPNIHEKILTEEDWNLIGEELIERICASCTSENEASLIVEVLSTLGGQYPFVDGEEDEEMSWRKRRGMISCVGRMIDGFYSTFGTQQITYPPLDQLSPFISLVLLSLSSDNSEVSPRKREIFDSIQTLGRMFDVRRLNEETICNEILPTFGEFIATSTHGNDDVLVGHLVSSLCSLAHPASSSHNHTFLSMSTSCLEFMNFLIEQTFSTNNGKNQASFATMEQCINLLCCLLEIVQPSDFLSLFYSTFSTLLTDHLTNLLQSIPESNGNDAESMYSMYLSLVGRVIDFGGIGILKLSPYLPTYDPSSYDTIISPMLHSILFPILNDEGDVLPSQLIDLHAPLFHLHHTLPSITRIIKVCEPELCHHFSISLLPTILDSLQDEISILRNENVTNVSPEGINSHSSSSSSFDKETGIHTQMLGGSSSSSSISINFYEIEEKVGYLKILFEFFNEMEGGEDEEGESRTMVNWGEQEEEIYQVISAIFHLLTCPVSDIRRQLSLILPLILQSLIPLSPTSIPTLPSSLDNGGNNDMRIPSIFITCVIEAMDIEPDVDTLACLSEALRDLVKVCSNAREWYGVEVSYELNEMETRKLSSVLLSQHFPKIVSSILENTSGSNVSKLEGEVEVIQNMSDTLSPLCEIHPHIMSPLFDQFVSPIISQIPFKASYPHSKNISSNQGGSNNNKNKKEIWIPSFQVSILCFVSDWMEFLEYNDDVLQFINSNSFSWSTSIVEVTELWDGSHVLDEDMEESLCTLLQCSIYSLNQLLLRLDRENPEMLSQTLEEFVFGDVLPFVSEFTSLLNSIKPSNEEDVLENWPFQQVNENAASLLITTLHIVSTTFQSPIHDSLYDTMLSSLPLPTSPASASPFVVSSHDKFIDLLKEDCGGILGENCERAEMLFPILLTFLTQQHQSNNTRNQEEEDDERVFVSKEGEEVVVDIMNSFQSSLDPQLISNLMSQNNISSIPGVECSLN